jgi:hypothetical protein
MKWYQRLLGHHQPFKVTGTNLEQVRAHYPGLLLLVRKKRPVCQSYLVAQCKEIVRFTDNGNRETKPAPRNYGSPAAKLEYTVLPARERQLMTLGLQITIIQR